MVLPVDFEVLPGLLRGDAARGWLRTDGAGLFRAFETGEQALSFARELGLQIRTQDFYSIRREILNVESSTTFLFTYPDNQLIPYNVHVQSESMKLTTEFQYRVHMYGPDKETGILRDQWMVAASDRQLTINEVKEIARSYLGEGGDSDRIVDPQFAEIEPLRR